MESYILMVAPLIAGYVLDLIFGDPRKLPHPIVLFGNMISKAEKAFNRPGTNLRRRGMLLVVFYCLLVYFGFYSLLGLCQEFAVDLYLLVATIFVFYGLANRSLLQEGFEVFKKLNDEGLEAGRQRLSWIVGRDTSQLSPQQIRTAVLETLSENLSDGVIAPLFYYAIGGVPAMMTYKMINTFDSMIGYKNERYLDFGRFAALLDDVANWIPARITAFLIAAVSFSGRSFRYIAKYGNRHSSPNAGYPESALAGVLNCRFGGPNYYGGKLVDKPYIGENEREIEHVDIFRTARVNHLSCLSTVVLISFVLWILG